MTYMKRIFFAFVTLVLVGITWGIYMKQRSNFHNRGELGMGSGWTIIIPGITGDLAKRKLIPALYRLYTQGMRAVVIGT